jgi:murein DD-endopeptidase MepM/ murein hydrolase activator NlpD
MLNIRSSKPFVFFSALVSAIVIVLSLTGESRPASATRGSASDVPAETNAVTITTSREGEVIHFFVENKEYSEITMTFDMSMTNLTGDVTFPYTTVFRPRQKVEAFTLSSTAPGAKWQYSYTNYYKLGSNTARHDDSFVYQLPYAPGDKYKVTQGYNGKFSHKGSNQYAIDWQMAEGTLVYAARGGVVVKVKDGSDKGGPSVDFDRYNNYVLIRHDDGTLAHYCHLQKGGVLVKVGQTVATGDVIAHSGNTGFSSGPHLHFAVFRTKDGRERVSIPVKFKTASDEAITLVSGRSYRATQVQSASARQPDVASLRAGG